MDKILNEMIDNSKEYLKEQLSKPIKLDLKFFLDGKEAVRDKINELIETNNIKRAQAVIRTDFPQAIKMIEFFGFTNETPNGMIGYCPDGADAFMYARLS